MRKIIVILFLMPVLAYGQEERSDIRSGNKLYKDGKYTQAEVKYKQASAKNATSYEAAFNLGGALYKQQRYEDAAVGYAKLTQDGNDISKQGDAFFNMGNTQLKMRKLDESIEAYKETLRRNPTDMQAKFNLAYAQKLKQEDDKKNQDNKDNQDNKENKDNQKNQDNKDNQDKQDNKDNPKNKDNKDQQQQDKQDNKDQQQQDNERMLKAVQASEDKTKNKVDQKQAQAEGVGGGKNW